MVRSGVPDRLPDAPDSSARSFDASVAEVAISA